jgi:hypothetical protein
MTSIDALFNTLPSLDQANKKFSNRKSIFPMLVAVLSGYEDKFGINLVHRHTTLDKGEKMVTIGNVTKPMKDVKCYPERWLVTGQAYVFNTEPTESPPEELLEKLKAVVDTVGYIGGVGVLGLAYIKNHPKAGSGKVRTEKTEGRADIMEDVPKNQKDMMETCWNSVDGEMRILWTCAKDPNGRHQSSNQGGQGPSY